MNMQSVRNCISPEEKHGYGYKSLQRITSGRSTASKKNETKFNNAKNPVRRAETLETKTFRT